MQRSKITRVELLCGIIMILQGANYIFQMFGNPVRWVANLSDRVGIVETKLADKIRIDSVYYAVNTNDHYSIKQDITLIKSALIRRN